MYIANQQRIIKEIYRTTMLIMLFLLKQSVFVTSTIQLLSQLYSYSTIKNSWKLKNILM